MSFGSHDPNTSQLAVFPKLPGGTFRAYQKEIETCRDLFRPINSRSQTQFYVFTSVTKRYDVFHKVTDQTRRESQSLREN